MAGAQRKNSMPGMSSSPLSYNSRLHATQEEGPETSVSTSTGSAGSTRTARPGRPPSTSSLRGPQSTRMPTRRESLSVGRGSPSSPTSRVPPSSSHSSIPMSPRTAGPQHRSSRTSRPSSISTSSTDDEIDLRPGAHTPRLGSSFMSHTHNSSSTPSPRLVRSSTLSTGDPYPSQNRRVSTATTSTTSTATGLIPPSRTLSTPVAGYGSTHSHNAPVLAGLGLGNPDQGHGHGHTHGSGESGARDARTRRPKKDDALASPRRISTSSPVPPEVRDVREVREGSAATSASGRQAHRSPASLLNLPTHEAFYSASQPGTSTTSRFRDRDVDPAAQRPHGPGHSRSHQPYTPGPARYSRHTHTHSQSSRHHRGNESFNHAMGSFLSPSTGGNGLHRRNLSVQTADVSGDYLRSQGMKSSPTNSVFAKMRRTASAVGLAVGSPRDYDHDRGDGHDEEDVDDDGDSGLSTNGTRVWYSSFVTIDWIHDAIKESLRVRRLRLNAHKSWRGAIANAWDRFQGWLVVTLIGIITAIIAFLIIRSEMALFDLKEGFCSTSWGTPQRFCCSPHQRRPPMGSSPNGGMDGAEEKCDNWVEWGQLFLPIGRQNEWMWGEPEFIAYGLVAVSLATLASVLTVYLSSSAHHTTSKDSQFLIPSISLSDAKSKTSTPRKGNGIIPASSERQPLMDASSTEQEEEEEILEEEIPDPPRKVMYYAAGSGIPEIKTILSGFVIHGYLGGWTLLTKSVGLALSVASGLSLGKEGPLVHISSCVGNIVSRLFIKFECNEAKRREILSAACAAGVSVAFGAPIGGVLFSLEEVSYYFPPKVMWRSFWCAAVAAIALKTLNPFGNGSLVLFAVSYTKEYHYWEYAIFVILGIFGGVYGAIFSRLNILWSKKIRQGTWVGRHPIIEVMLVTTLTTLVSFLNPYCRMGGTELVASLFAECRDNSMSPLCVSHPREIASVIYTIGEALLIKGALTIITFGIKLPAGIFIPSLAVGACFGRIVGLSMEWIEQYHGNLPIFDVCRDRECIVPGLYAMIGAAATLAGVTRTTVSLAVIVIELTATLNYVVPVMLSVLVAKTVADGLEKKGIYDLVIDLNQLPYLDAKGEHLWGSRRVSEIADREVPHLRADKSHTVRYLTGKLLELSRLGLADTGFPVLVKEQVESDGRIWGTLRVVGFLGMNELEHALNTLSDELDATLNLMPEDLSSRARNSVLSIFSFAESVSDPRHNPYDISRYIDRAPITVQIHSPLELVQQLFVKLGARQLLVTDSRGTFRGMVTKKAWLNFLQDLEEERH